jgi:Glucose-6-phosphate dehydrogenase, C-terminal domain
LAATVKHGRLWLTDGSCIRLRPQHRNHVWSYEATGAYRDMVVTHLFQILAFMAMEPPTALEPGPIGEEKNKVFRSMLPIDPKNVVRGRCSTAREFQECGRFADSRGTELAAKAAQRPAPSTLYSKHRLDCTLRRNGAKPITNVANWLYLSDDGKRDRLSAALRPTSAMLAYSAKGAFCRKSTDEGRVYPGMNFNPKSAMKLSLVVFGWFLAMPQRHVVN